MAGKRRKRRCLLAEHSLRRLHPNGAEEPAGSVAMQKDSAKALCPRSREAWKYRLDDKRHGRGPHPVEPGTLLALQLLFYEEKGMASIPPSGRRLAPRRRQHLYKSQVAWVTMQQPNGYPCGNPIKTVVDSSKSAFR